MLVFEREAVPREWTAEAGTLKCGKPWSLPKPTTRFEKRHGVLRLALHAASAAPEQKPGLRHSCPATPTNNNPKQFVNRALNNHTTGREPGIILQKEQQIGISA
jgi:hypothetical protein